MNGVKPRILRDNSVMTHHDSNVSGNRRSWAQNYRAHARLLTSKDVLRQSEEPSYTLVEYREEGRPTVCLSLGDEISSSQFVAHYLQGGADERVDILGNVFPRLAGAILTLSLVQRCLCSIRLHSPFHTLFQCGVNSRPLKETHGLTPNSPIRQKGAGNDTRIKPNVLIYCIACMCDE